MQVLLMNTSESTQVSMKRRGCPITSIAMDLASAIPVIIPCPLARTVPDGGVEWIVGTIALPLVGIELCPANSNVFGNQPLTGPHMCVITHPEALLARLPRDQTMIGSNRWHSYHFMREVGGVDLMKRVQGTAMQRERVPVVQYLWLYGLKTLRGIERMDALPALLVSDAALRRLVGFNAQQVRHGVCRRGVAKRQGPRTEGPLCPDVLAKHLV
jgi:hypothetical protein